MGYRVSGILKLPDGSPASNAEIEFISRKNFSPLVQELKSNILCGLDGAYDVTLEHGEYAVMVYPGGTYPAALGTITLASDTIAGQDLPTLLQQAGWQPATPEYIQQIAAWLAEANASVTSSAASASAAKVSETNAAASASAAASAIVTHEGKAGAHPISGVTDLQAALDGKYSPTNKPTAADVGAAASTHYYDGDLNNLTISGFYSLQPGVLNAPSSRTGLGDQLTHHQWDNNAANQTYLAHNIKQMWLRHKVGGNWSSWTEVYHEANVVGSGGIIERGSNANGEYVKLADGTIIMWGIKSTAFAIDTATGSMFRSGAIAYDFPTNLLTKSSATVKTNCAGVRVEISTATHYFNSTSQAVAYFLAPTSITETTYPISFFVTGRWK